MPKQISEKFIVEALAIARNTSDEKAAAQRGFSVRTLQSRRKFILNNPHSELAAMYRAECDRRDSPTLKDALKVACAAVVRVCEKSNVSDLSFARDLEETLQRLESLESRRFGLSIPAVAASCVGSKR